jgi:FixJ family two-component response regulator
MDRYRDADDDTGGSHVHDRSLQFRDLKRLCQRSVPAAAVTRYGSMEMDPILVAIVDDEAAVRGALGRLLRLAGYQVVGFESGENFLASLPLRVPACALLDVNMPGLSGLQVQARLLADRVALPVVFITANDDPAVDRLALEAGGLGVLHKPFGNDVLLAAIQSALQGTPS